jgi:secretory lipase
MLLLSYELIHSFNRAAADAQMAIWGYPSPPHPLPPSHNDVDVYRVVHRTPDRNGTLVPASGLVAVPKGIEGPRPLVSFQHGTATQRVSAPSNFNYQVQTAVFGFATGGYVVSCTDYLGLGSSPVLHPYVIAAANARVALDMIRATRELCDRLGVLMDTRLYVTGYSEGGHTAMAVARAAQADGSSEFAITACAPLAGVYNLLVGATPELAAKAPPGTGLLFVAYTLLAWQAYYGDLYRSLHDVFRFPFSAMVPRLFDGTLSLDRTRETLYAAAVEQYRRDHPDDPRAQPPVTTFDVLTPEFTAAFVDPASPMGRRIRENSVHDWTPRMPMYLVGARNDSQVPFASTLDAVRTMRRRGVLPATLNFHDQGPQYDHLTAVAAAYALARLFFDGGWEAVPKDPDPAG